MKQYSGVKYHRVLDKEITLREDELPGILTEAEKDEWLKSSWVITVRMGYGFKWEEAK